MIWHLFLGREATRRFTVFEPPRPAHDRIDRAEALEFVADRFSWPAFLFGGVWLAGQRLWLWLGAYVAALLAINLVIYALGLGRPWLWAAAALAHLLLGFEAEALLGHAYERRGWSRLGDISGRSRDDCERRFFEAWLPTQSMRGGGGAATAVRPLPQPPQSGLRASIARLFGS